jgi:hypothetical protein
MKSTERHTADTQITDSADNVVASVTLNYQLIRNSLEFENVFFLFKN